MGKTIDFEKKNEDLRQHLVVMKNFCDENSASTNSLFGAQRDSMNRCLSNYNYYLKVNLDELYQVKNMIANQMDKNKQLLLAHKMEPKVYRKEAAAFKALDDNANKLLKNTYKVIDSHYHKIIKNLKGDNYYSDRAREFDKKVDSICKTNNLFVAKVFSKKAIDFISILMDTWKKEMTERLSAMKACQANPSSMNYNNIIKFTNAVDGCLEIDTIDRVTCWENLDGCEKNLKILKSNNPSLNEIISIKQVAIEAINDTTKILDSRPAPGKIYNDYCNYINTVMQRVEDQRAAPNEQDSIRNNNSQLLPKNNNSLANAPYQNNDNVKTVSNPEILPAPPSYQPASPSITQF